MTIEEVVEMIRELKEDFEREEDRGVEAEDISKAKSALAGRYALDRLLRRIESRTGLHVVEPRRMGRAR